MRRALMLARGPPTVAALLSRSPSKIECIRVKGSLGAPTSGARDQTARRVVWPA